MGCHTWFRKPLVKGKEEVKAYILSKIDRYRQKEWWDEEFEEDAQKTIETLAILQENMSEELLTIAGFDESIYFVNGEPIVYTRYERDSDEPRIGGYPETIIRSADEMFKAMKTGLIGNEGKTYDFYIEPGRETIIQNHINTFFAKYPDGIIEFG